MINTDGNAAAIDRHLEEQEQYDMENMIETLHDEVDRLEAQRDELLGHLKMAQLWLDVDGRFDMQGINEAIAKCEAKP